MVVVAAIVRPEHHRVACGVHHGVTVHPRPAGGQNHRGEGFAHVAGQPGGGSVRRVSLGDFESHLGGHAIQRDAGGVLPCVHGGSVKGGAVLRIGDAGNADCADEIVFQLGSFCRAVVGWTGRCLDGHAAAADGAAAALGGDGVTRCIHLIRPTVLMCSKGEIALIVSNDIVLAGIRVVGENLGVIQTRIGCPGGELT